MSMDFRAFVYYMNFHTALLGPLRLTQHLRKAGPDTDTRKTEFLNPFLGHVSRDVRTCGGTAHRRPRLCPATLYS